MKIQDSSLKSFTEVMIQLVELVVTLMLARLLQCVLG